MENKQINQIAREIDARGQRDFLDEMKNQIICEDAEDEEFACQADNDQVKAQNL